MELPVYLVKEHISDFCVTLPLCVAFTEPNLYPWYYENFINICSTNREKSICFSKYGPTFMGMYDEIFKYTEVLPSMIKEEDICEIIISQLTGDKNYCYIILNEYYISCKKEYRKSHFLHQSLIYGYDFDEKVFLAIAFNKKDHLDYLKYSYQEVLDAFKYNDLYKSVVFFKLWTSKEKYKFSLMAFVENIEHYINSSCRYAEKFWSDSIDSIDRKYYGVSAIRHCLDVFSESKGIDYYDFRNIHFIYEHKKGILRRLEYLNAEGYLNDIHQRYISQYEGIVNSYKILRMIALKALYTEKVSINYAIQKRIKSSIMVLIDEEIECLINIIRSIQNNSLDCSFNNLCPEHILTENDGGKEIYEFYYHKTITCWWSERKNITNLVITKYNLIDIIVDDKKKYKLFTQSANKLDRYDFKLNASCEKIKFVIQSDVEIEEDVLIQFYQQDLTYNQPIFASSYFDKKNDKCDYLVELDGSNYWRAAEQTEGYDGSDWIEVDFQKPTCINTILLGELDSSHRIKRYRIKCYLVNGQWVELLTHDFKKGSMQIHKFETIEVHKLRVEFVECEMEQNGYYEPIVYNFKVYNIK